MKEMHRARYVGRAEGAPMPSPGVAISHHLYMFTHLEAHNPLPVGIFKEALLQGYH